jgi:predicted alpha/beta-fold hydrolase
MLKPIKMSFFYKEYNPPFLFKNTHANTILAALFRKKWPLNYKRQRFILNDGDFVDLDFVHKGEDKLVILLHGLEGSSDRAYIRGMAKIFSQNNFDVLSFNFRGCSGEPNLTLKGYHMAATEDLEELVLSLHKTDTYISIYLIGFSLGGSVVLRFLANQGNNPAYHKVKGGVAFSVPLHLIEANKAIGKLENFMYRLRFLRSLKKKMKLKQEQFPEIPFLPAKWKYNFTFFDDFYTGPFHGFLNAKDYWTKAGVLSQLPKISLPCLLVNAEDDSFLSPYCFPNQLANERTNFYFLKPKWGGHVGFMPVNKNGFLWSEELAFHFIETIHQKGDNSVNN